MCGRHHATWLGVTLLVAVTALSPAQAPSGERENVAIVLTPYNPPITIPDAGGTFGYNIDISNNEAGSLAFQVWTTYTPPGGGATETGYGPVDLLLPGGWSAQRDLTQIVSGGLPDGVCTYMAIAGIYPGDVWSSDSFELEKLPGDAGWYAQSSGAENRLSGVSFVDANTGWAVSDYQEIIHTSDGGDTWQQQDDGQYYPHQYNDVCFVDTQTGWVVGHGWSLGGTILHTTDAGATWVEQQPDDDYELYSVFFLDADNGWVAGGYFDIYGSNHRRVIEHTSDGGETWEGQHWQSYRHPLVSVHFADVNNGWAVGGPGYILHTPDGGDTWSEQTSGTSSYLQSVFFADAKTGWCVGDNGTVLHTVNGGGSWQVQNPGSSAEFRAVFFSDVNTGWIAGVDYYVYRPVILHTADGGLTWEPQDTNTGDAEITIHDICFVDSNHGWASGSLWPDTGVMLHTENGGAAPFTGVDDAASDETEPMPSSVSAPYPNPFNPRTRIRFSVPAGPSRPVTIALYDVKGRQVRQLVDGSREPGRHVVDWDGRTESGEPAASGVYFYRVAIGDESASGKLTLLR